MQEELFFAYPKYCNQTVNWLPMDTKKLFDYNKENNFSLLKQNNWIDRTIEYTFNSKGFRCNEFSNYDSIIFLGCSYTIGIGLPIANTFSYIVADKISLQNFNLGLAGGSNSSSFRLGYYWIPKIKPKIVVQLSTFNERFEIINGITSTRMSLLKSKNKYYNFYRDWAGNEYNGKLDEIKNTEALHKICIDNGAKFLSFSVLDNLATSYVEGDRARDLAHFGCITHQNFANHVLNKIDSVTN